MPLNTKLKPVISYLDPELYKRFLAIAKKEKRSISQMISIAIEKYVFEYETGRI